MLDNCCLLRNLLLIPIIAENPILNMYEEAAARVSSYPLIPAVSTRQAAGDGKMREGLPGSFPHAHLSG
ncbi:hypothetical protein T03_2405 [Trichinella britovi]|uniref:Uncharacterized protein n=1 Tax=Trichinella britovi TaxID=45882 RepID=A0A0V1CE28_TRIBR|nr:hypothetical protein T03_2405 [Trichinella britovi]